MMNQTKPVDVARAAQLAAAVAADDMNSAGVILKQTMDDQRLPQMSLALAVHLSKVAKEFYDTDCQTILDGFAMDAMLYAETAD
jgi:hypothetical protein